MNLPTVRDTDVIPFDCTEEVDPKRVELFRVMAMETYQEAFGLVTIIDFPFPEESDPVARAYLEYLRRLIVQAHINHCGSGVFTDSITVDHETRTVALVGKVGVRLRVVTPAEMRSLVMGSLGIDTPADPGAAR